MIITYWNLLYLIHRLSKHETDRIFPKIPSFSKLKIHSLMSYMLYCCSFFTCLKAPWGQNYHLVKTIQKPFWTNQKKCTNNTQKNMKWIRLDKIALRTQRATSRDLPQFNMITAKTVLGCASLSTPFKSQLELLYGSTMSAAARPIINRSSSPLSLISS